MNQLKGQATPADIDKWKKEIKEKYGQNHKVFKYEVDGSICYLRSVDRDTYALAAAKVSTNNPTKFNDVVIERIWLGGDDRIRKEDGLYFGLTEFVQELMSKKVGELGEL